MKQYINPRTLENELTFFWLSKYMQDPKKPYLLDEETLENIDADKEIANYIKKNKYKIKYLPKSDTVKIYKWKEIELELNADKFKLTDEQILMNSAQAKRAKIIEEWLVRQWVTMDNINEYKLKTELISCTEEIVKLCKADTNELVAELKIWVDINE